MRRYTITDLRQQIDRINDELEREGIPYRMEEGGRNGYQAVDLYKIPRKNGCIERTIGCGTSREVADYARSAFQNLLIDKLKERLSSC